MRPPIVISEAGANSVENLSYNVAMQPRGCRLVLP
jgi:hypothetical protein